MLSPRRRHEACEAEEYVDDQRGISVVLGTDDLKEDIQVPHHQVGILKEDTANPNSRR